MSDRDTELEQLKARVAELEAQPQSNDLEWLRTSNVFKRAELATNPTFLRWNAIIVLGGIALFFGIPILHLILSK
ncbi:MAG: hypothetical protein H7255_10900 [Ramlibacter sp.]|nr:hypothetical protein [Ramlibacter sp.]